jgi:uncharacterized protein
MSRALIRRWLPDQEKLRANPAFSWLGPILNRTSLWQVNRNSVALGLAIGIFFGLIVPVAQILFAGVAALILRANLPVAALATLVSNPFTIVPLYVLAYQIGVAMLGSKGDDAPIAWLAGNLPTTPAAIAPWVDQLAQVAAPLFTGLGMMALLGACSGYIVIQIIWIAPTLWRVTRRRWRLVRGA